MTDLLSTVLMAIVAGGITYHLARLVDRKT